MRIDPNIQMYTIHRVSGGRHHYQNEHFNEDQNSIDMESPMSSASSLTEPERRKTHDWLEDDSSVSPQKIKVGQSSASSASYIQVSSVDPHMSPILTLTSSNENVKHVDGNDISTLSSDHGDRKHLHHDQHNESSNNKSNSNENRKSNHNQKNYHDTVPVNNTISDTDCIRSSLLNMKKMDNSNDTDSEHTPRPSMKWKIPSVETELTKHPTSSIYKTLLPSQQTTHSKDDNELDLEGMSPMNSQLSKQSSIDRPVSGTTTTTSTVQ